MAPTSTLSAPIILVVDDNEDAAVMLAAILESWGMRPEVVHTGVAAVERAQATQPRVILLDLGLPDINGLEVARRLRAHPRTAHTGIIATTGWGSETDRRATDAAGFDYHLVKPVDLSRLRDLIRGLLNRSTSRPRLLEDPMASA